MRSTSVVLAESTVGCVAGVENKIVKQHFPMKTTRKARGKTGATRELQDSVFKDDSYYYNHGIVVVSRENEYVCTR